MGSSVELKNLPMEEAIEYWQDKVPLSNEEFAQLAEDARAKAFFMSGLTEQSIVAQVMGEMAKALTDGITYEEFKKNVAPVLEKAGWEEERPWRLRTSVYTNVLTAYSVGRYKQMQAPAVLKARPFWEYLAVIDSQTRPTHAALDGKVFAASDPIWDSIYPPNGFLCRCTVRTRSQSDLDRDGTKVEKGSDVLGKMAEVDGKSVVVQPDKGWNSNVAKAHWGDELVRQQKAVAGSPSMVGGSSPSGSLPAVPPDTEDYQRIDADTVKDAWQTAFRRRQLALSDATGKPVLLNDRLADYLDKKDVDRKRARHLAAVRPTIERPAEVWMLPMRYQDGRVVLRKHYLKRFADKEMLVVVQADAGVWTGFNVLPMNKLKEFNKRRRGIRIYERTSAALTQQHVDQSSGYVAEAHRPASTQSYDIQHGGQ